MPASSVSAGPFVHPSALCESPDVGEGTRIWAFAHVLKGAVVGRDCNIGDHAFIEGGAVVGDRVTIKNSALIWDGVTIEDDAFIGPGVVFTNDLYPRSPRMPGARARYAHPDNWRVPTRVCRGASIGAGAVILCGVTIGSFAAVGAGTVVTRNVPDHRLVVGNPARPAGWMCRCGMRLDESLSCPRCARRFVLRDDGLEEAD
ncbi:MAG TPA: acyltransferase [Phycisphaerae bacterium]|nr:acyltransferase [Phycisphaerae bacterium]HRR85424.1 acyltransferase [Phycisphaerae bacterium]